MGNEIIVVGMGPGPVKYLTQEARDVLLAEQEIFFRLSVHPVYQWLRDQGKDCVSFDALYNQSGISYERIYKTINQALVKTAKKQGRAVYALPGHPYVFEKTPRMLRQAAHPQGVEVKVVTGLSFIEMIYQELEIDPEEGLQIINACGFSAYGDYPFTEKLPLLIGQVGLPAELDPTGQESNVQATARALLKKFPPDHKVTLIWSKGMPDYENETRTFKLADLPEQSGYVPFLATLYVPPIKPPWESARDNQKQ